MGVGVLDEHAGEFKQLPLSGVSSPLQQWRKTFDRLEKGPDDGETQLRVSGKSLSVMIDLGVKLLIDASVDGVGAADDGRLRDPAWFRRLCWRSSSLATAEESCLVLVN